MKFQCEDCVTSPKKVILMKTCDNCCSKGFCAYVLAQETDLVVPRIIYRCNSCGVTLSEDEYNSLAEDPDSPA
jgi:hypothetical protein